MTYLNFVSFFGIFGLCFVAWIFSEDRRVIPWRVIIWGIGLQLVLGFFIFQLPITREWLQRFSDLLNGLFDSADTGARFVFGRLLVPPTGQEPYALLPLKPDGTCAPGQVLLDDLTTAANAAAKYCTTNRLAYVFAFRALPAVIFFSGFMALLENLGIIQIIVNVFAKLFFWTMRLSGAEALSGAANIFVGIEAAIVVKPYLPKMTRSELCAILACCFGTAASSTLAIYTSFLKPVFPNILGHLVSASIIAIPACFVLSKILVPETEIPVTMGGIPKEDKSAKSDEDGELENAGGETMKRMSPMDATIIGALDGLKMAASIAAILIIIVGLVDLINQIFAWLATISDIFGKDRINLQNIQGALFYPLTLLTGVSLDDSWKASVIIGRRLLETAIPPYQALAQAAQAGEISDRTVIIVSYALSGFAHLASVGIFVGGTIALIPSRRRDISDLGWKALFVGTLATLMIACIAGVFDDGSPSILGEKKKAEPVQVKPAVTNSPSASPTASPNASPSISPSITSPSPSPSFSPKVSPSLR